MKHSEKLAPVAALAAALSTVVCCLPLGFAAALGTAGLSMLLGWARPWLLGIAFVFLAIGIYQLFSARRACRRTSRATLALYGICTVALLALTLFPQAVAGFLADLGGSRTPVSQPAVADIDTQSLEALKSAFNRAAGGKRIIVLLSPT